MEKKITFTKRELRRLFRKVFNSAEKMCNLPYEDKKFYPDKEDRRRYQIFIQDSALEYIMRIYTDRAFGEKSNNKKHYTNIYGNKAS